MSFREEMIRVVYISPDRGRLAATYAKFGTYLLEYDFERMAGMFDHG